MFAHRRDLVPSAKVHLLSPTVVAACVVEFVVSSVPSWAVVVTTVECCDVIIVVVVVSGLVLVCRVNSVVSGSVVVVVVTAVGLVGIVAGNVPTNV